MTLPRTPSLPLEKIEQAARCLKALAHPLRLAILCALREQEYCVQELETLTGSSQSNMSSHLATMRDRGILTTRKDGASVYYQVRDPKMFEFLDILQALYCPDEA